MDDEDNTCHYREATDGEVRLAAMDMAIRFYPLQTKKDVVSLAEEFYNFLRAQTTMELTTDG